ncbi:ABC transporter permease [Actinophytocola sp.]|uniref:ABC transporter permease n=1 Tax=Actinophytocola sp. TaxID=1872138 RepID=UPI002ED49909
MHATTLVTSAPASGEVDSRAAYVSFGLAYVFGHGAAALSKGTDPVLAMPGWLPMALLAAGLVAGTAYSIGAATRAQRGLGKAELLSARLVGSAWITGFVALFLAITGLTGAFDKPELQAVLWPAGSTLVVGLIYLAEGSVRRNTLHYGLGTWLTLVGGASLLFSTPGLFWVLTVAGGGAYAVATILERRRLSCDGPGLQYRTDSAPAQSFMDANL